MPCTTDFSMPRPAASTWVSGTPRHARGTKECSGPFSSGAKALPPPNPSTHSQAASVCSANFWLLKGLDPLWNLVLRQLSAGAIIATSVALLQS